VESDKDLESSDELCAQLVNKVEVKKLEIVHSFTGIQDMVRVVEEDFAI